MGKGGELAAAVPAHGHTVVMQTVLIQQSGVYEATDDLGGEASLLKIGKHPLLVPVGNGQGEDGLTPSAFGIKGSFPLDNSEWNLRRRKH